MFHELLPLGTTAKKYYSGILRRLREDIRKKRPDLWKDSLWKLQHDNVPPHTPLVVQERLPKIKM